MSTKLDDAVAQQKALLEKEVKGELSRRDVRSLIFHILYAAESHDYLDSLESIVENVNNGFETSIALDGEVFNITKEIVTKREQLDEQIKPLLVNWRFDRIGVCTKLVLRFAMWEFIFTDTSAKIIINEAVELAKCFAEKDAYKFVNGILDEAVKALRPDEIMDKGEQEE